MRRPIDMVDPIKANSFFADRRSGAIYRTAARMIHEKGFDATSMNEIAKALGMTKPGLYYHVKGKRQLLFAIMDNALGLLDSKVITPTKSIADPEERLRAIISRCAELLTYEGHPQAILIDEVGAIEAKHRGEIVRRKRACFKFLRQTLDELKAEGRLRPKDTTAAAFSLIGMVMWISRWYNPEGMDSGQVVRDVTEIALGGIVLPAGGKPPKV